MQCRISDITDTDPSSPDEIIGELTPVLALVVPTGMDTQARRIWFHAAVRALEGIPIRLLQRGAAAAMLKADHPSKIVATIMKEIADDWKWRKRMRGPSVVADPPRPEPKRIEDNSPLPFDQVKVMPLSLRKMGLSHGWVSQADFDRAARYDPVEPTA